MKKILEGVNLTSVERSLLVYLYSAIESEPAKIVALLTIAEKSDASWEYRGILQMFHDVKSKDKKAINEVVDKIRKHLM